MRSVLEKARLAAALGLVLNLGTGTAALAGGDDAFRCLGMGSGTAQEYRALFQRLTADTRLQRVRTRADDMEGALSAIQEIAQGAPSTGLSPDQTRLIHEFLLTQYDAPHMRAPERIALRRALSDAQRQGHGFEPTREQARLVRDIIRESAAEQARGRARTSYTSVDSTAEPPLTMDEYLARREVRHARVEQTRDSAPRATHTQEYAELRTRVLEAPETRAYQSRHTVAEGVSDRGNPNFIAEVRRESATGAGPEALLYLDVENPILKELNDTVFQSSDLANAVNNHFKEILARLIQAHPQLRTRFQYNDYKSLRFSFDTRGLTPEQYVQMENALRGVFSNATEIFSREIGQTPIAQLLPHLRGLARDPRTWFLGGIARTADEAGVATRFGRQVFGRGVPPGQPVRPTHFREAETQLQQGLRRAEELRTIIQREYPREALSSGMLVPVEGTQPPAYVLSSDTIELIRKVGGTDAQFITALRPLLENRFGLRLTDSQLLVMRDYYTTADTYSPNLLIDSRIELGVATAPQGVISADFTGQGARNGEATLAALAEAAQESRGDVRETLRTVRRREIEATAHFDTIRRVFSDAASRAGYPEWRMSGDDGISRPTRPATAEDRARLIGELAGVRHPEVPPASFRMTFTPPTYVDTGAPIPGELFSNMIKEAEGFEKALRLRLEADLRSRPELRRALRRVVFGVEVQPRADGTETFRLLVGGDIPEALQTQIRQSAEAAAAYVRHPLDSAQFISPARRSSRPPPRMRSSAPPSRRTGLLNLHFLPVQTQWQQPDLAAA